MSLVLSTEQQAALDIICKTRQHIFLTGEAGTGKSVLIRAVAEAMEVAITATTGLAALNVGGTTVDRLFNINRDEWVIRNRRKLANNMMACPDDIVIDEISMAGHCMLNLLRDCAEEFGKRLIMVGDLAQAAPVKDIWGVNSTLFLGAEKIKLREVHRQKDPVFINALRSIRRGEPDEEASKVMLGCVGKPDERHTMLFATNKDVDKHNDRMLAKLVSPGPDVLLRASFKDHRDEDLKELHPAPEGQIRSFMDDSRLANGEVVRIGARVMMTKNGRDEVSYVNGDCGEIVDIIDDNGFSVRDSLLYKIPSDKIHHLLIKLDRWDEPIEVERAMVASLDAEEAPVFSAFGFPVRLGWAVTTHKCQGMSLDNVFIDIDTISKMKTKESTHGLAYVAVSRARTREGLRIARWAPELVYCDPAVKPFL